MSRIKALMALVIGTGMLGIGSQTYAQAQNPAEVKGDPARDRAAVDHILTTTRSVRKRLDLKRPVEVKVIDEAINVALQAPTGSNAQGWYFIVVTDPDKKKAIADLYRKGADMYRSRPRTEYGAKD